MSLIFLPIKVFILNYYRLIRNKKKYVIFNLIYEFSRILLFFILIFGSYDVINSYVLSLFLLNLLILLEILLLKKGSYRSNYLIFNKSMMNDFKNGLYLISVLISSISGMYIIRIFIEKQIGIKFVGYFLLVFSILQIVPFFYRAINLAFTPFFFSNIKENSNEAVYYLKKVTDNNIFFAIIYSFFSYIFLLFYNNFYSNKIDKEVLNIFPYIALNFILLTVISFYNNILIAQNKEKLIGLINLISLLLLVVFSVLLLKLFGFIGAGLSLIIYSIVVIFLSVVFSKIRYYPSKTVYYFLIFFIMIFLVKIL